MRHFFVAIVLAATLAAGVPRSRGQEAVKSNASASAPAASQTVPIVFTEVSPGESKITWVHDNGRSEAHHLPETCGGGGLFFDYDNDGWMDIYLVNSGPSDFFSPKTPSKH